MRLRTRLFRLLMLHQGEGRIVLFLSLIAALTGFGLSIGRASSDALFFTQYGADNLPLMFALIALVLVPLSLGYAAFVDRISPYRLFNHLLLGFAAMVGMAWLAMLTVVGNLGIALYFIAYGVISELLLLHFSHYTSYFFDAQQAKRLFPSVMAIFRLGAILGGVFLGVAGSTIAPYNVALVWALCLISVLGLVAWRHRGEPIYTPIKRGRASTPVQMLREGLMFSHQSRLVRIIALGVFLLVLLLSVQEYLVGSIFAGYYPDEHQLTAFFGWFSAILNTCLLLLQLFVFGRLLRRFGLKTMNLVYPVTTLLSFGLMALSAGYLTAVLGRINAVGILPGVRNTVSGFFFHALPGYMQGRAHALIAALVLPSGLLVSALFLWWVPKDLPLEWVSGGGFAVALLFFWVKLKKNAAYADSLVELVSQSVFVRDGEAVAESGGLDRVTACQLAGYMRETDSSVTMLNYADLLVSLAREHAGVAMLSVYADLPVRQQDQLLARIARLMPAGWESVAWDAAQCGDAHLAETTARLLLAAGYPGALAHAETWLETGSPRLRAAAAVGCLHGDAADLKPMARATLEALLQSGEPDAQLAALGALAAMPHGDLLPLIRPMLFSEQARMRAFALDIWSRCPHAGGDDTRAIIDDALASPSCLVRAAAIRAAAHLPSADLSGLDRLSRALRDQDHRVRLAAQTCASAFMPKHADAWAAALEHYGSDFDLQQVMIAALAASGVKRKASILNQHTAWHVGHARKTLLIRDCIAESGDQDAPQWAFLMQVLREEARRHLDSVLYILCSLGQGREMSYIRGGLSSEDRRLWAQTMESAMQHKQHSHLFYELAILYEAERDGVALSGVLPGGKAALRDGLAWCQAYGSEWLAESVRYSLGDKKGAT